ncbi:hypothetical protein BC629DRAFT_1031656 [Irpex lacteus]|nr:hypothetical protein BC629DRAFT_1031656 [Irpex lacteus]
MSVVWAAIGKTGKSPRRGHWNLIEAARTFTPNTCLSFFSDPPSPSSSQSAPQSKAKFISSICCAEKQRNNAGVVKRSVGYMGRNNAEISKRPRFSNHPRRHRIRTSTAHTSIHSNSEEYKERQRQYWLSRITMQCPDSNALDNLQESARRSCSRHESQCYATYTFGNMNFVESCRSEEKICHCRNI